MLQHVVVTAWRAICKQVHALGTFPQPVNRPMIGPGGDHQVHVLDITEQPWQFLRGRGGKALVQRVDQNNDLGFLTRLAHPFERQRYCLYKRCLRLESAQVNIDPRHRPAGSNIAGVDLDVPHVDLTQQRGPACVRKPRARLGDLVRQPLRDIEQVDPARAAEVGSGNWHGPTWRSFRSGRGEPTSCSESKLCRDRGLAGARGTEQEKRPWWPVKKLIKAGENPASASEMRRPLLDIGPVKFRELHGVAPGPPGPSRSDPRRSPHHHCPHCPRAPGLC